MKKTLLLPLLALLWLACQKDKSEPCPAGLPCATQTGENTMGCYINGQPWQAKVEPFIWDPTAHDIEVHYDETDYQIFSNNLFSLKGRYAGTIDSSSYMIIQFFDLKNLGSMIFDSLSIYNIEYSNIHHNYNIDLNFPYEINITKLDTEKNIASGTFFFTGVSQHKTDTVRITDGRFDVKYDQY